MLWGRGHGLGHTPGNAPEHSNVGGKTPTTTTPTTTTTTTTITPPLAAAEEPGPDAAVFEVDLEPWTRSVRLALLGLLPVAALVLAAGLRQRSRNRQSPTEN